MIKYTSVFYRKAIVRYNVICYKLYSSTLPNLFFFLFDLEINDLHKTSWILHLKPIGLCTHIHIYIYYNIITMIGSRHSDNTISECFT